jgi:hypothetical protein
MGVRGNAWHHGAMHGVRRVLVPLGLGLGLLVASQAMSGPTAQPQALQATAAYSGPSKILLTPTRSTSTSQEVSWTMSVRTSGQRVQYRSAKGGAGYVAAARRPSTRRVTAGSSAPRYEATLTGLRSGTTYEYRILTRHGNSAWQRFSTAASSAASTTLIGLGDLQVENRGVPRATVRAALAAVPESELILQAGDVVNLPTSGTEWDDLFAAIGRSGRTRNWVVAIGNHEQCMLITCDSNKGAAFRSYFDGVSNGFPGQAQTWYAVDYQNVRIVVLDSFGGRLDDQARFLDEALTENPFEWSIVVMHAPPFASRPGRTNPDVVSTLLPVIEEHDVDLVLTGHDHSYARGYRTDPSGPVYITSNSGPKNYEASEDDWVANGATRTIWATGVATYQVVTIKGDTLSYRAVLSSRTVDSSSTGHVGDVLDSFEIDRSEAGKVVK